MDNPSRPASGYTLSEVEPGSFVYEVRHALPDEACQDMIRRFEAKPEQQYPGRIGPQQQHEHSIKRSTDLRISGRHNWREVDEGLFLSLRTALDALSAIHPFFASNSFRDMGYNMQRTRPGEFYHRHVDSGAGEFSQRQLVAIWYLNDVDGPRGGKPSFTFSR